METKICQNCKQNFIIEPDDFSFYEKMSVPAPTFCPECRLIFRFASRNERSFYRRECDLCKNKILSIYSPEEPYMVYCPTCWWSDKWDPISYGIDYDSTKTFFEQFAEFKKSVPHQSLFQSNFINSEYANFGDNYKNCYLVSGGWDNEDLFYANQVNNVTDSFDILLSNHLDQSYETIQSSRSSKLRYCNACEDCSDLYLCTDCRGCVSCFGCVGLRNKQYCIYNEQYSKEEYKKIIENIRPEKYTSLLEAKKKYHDILLSHPCKPARFRNVINSSGDNLSDCKNAMISWSGNKLEDVKFTFFLSGAKEAYDASFIGKGGEKIYQVISSFGGENQLVGVRTLFNRNAYYSEDCHNCNDIFACMGLKKKSYCIFNREYSKEDYERLRTRITEDMKNNPYEDSSGRKYTFGDFWPISNQPFGYNETKAQEYFPLSKEQALDKGYRWREKEEKNYKISLRSQDMPDTLPESEISITNEIIGCAHEEQCKHNCIGAFKILPRELEFCKQLKVPLPRLCPNCRHLERIAIQNPPSLWHRACMCNKENHGHGEKCPNEFETNYAPNRPEIVYCESCYQKEML